MASNDSGQFSEQTSTVKEDQSHSKVASLASTGYQAASSAIGAVYGLFRNYKQEKTESTVVTDVDSGMAARTRSTKPDIVGKTPADQLPARFTDTEETDNGFVRVNIEPHEATSHSGISHIDSEEDDSTYALRKTLDEKEKLHKNQGKNLRKISELEKRLKQKDAELETMKMQASTAHQPRTAGNSDNELIKEKDQRIRYLERQLDHAVDREERVTQLTIEMTRKDEEINRLKKAMEKGATYGTGKGHVPQEPMTRQNVQQLTAELEKWREHSKSQSRQVLSLRQEVERLKAELNKADFEEERRDRTKAHSKLADLESQRVKSKSHFEHERATYEQHIASLQQDLSTVKKQLKSHMQELAHFEKYGKKKEVQIKELTDDKIKLKSMLKQYKRDNEQLKAQLTQAAASMVSMTEEMRAKKGKKKTLEEVSSKLKKFRKAVSSKLSERSEEPMECELTEAQSLIDMLCKTLDEKEDELHQLRAANKEMSKTLTAGPKAMKKYSYTEATHGDQPCSMDDEAMFDVDSEEHTAGTSGLLGTDLKQTTYPSTFATQDQVPPLPTSNTHLSTKIAAYKGGDTRRGSDPALILHSQTSSSTLPTNAKQPSMLRANSNPGPRQSSGSAEQPLRAVAPQPPTTNPNISEDIQPCAKQPVRATAPPPVVQVTIQSDSSFQQPTPPHGQRQHPSGGSVQPRQQAIENLLPQEIRFPPKMHSSEKQRDAETGQNANQRPVHSQPQPHQQFGQSSQKCQDNFQGTSGGQLQPASQERSYSEHQLGHLDAMYPPETQHTPHSHPIGANQHSSARPPVTKPPGSNVSGRGTAQPYDPQFRKQPLHPQGAFSQHGTHGNQPHVPINQAHQGSIASDQHPRTQERSGDFSTYVNIGNVLPPKQSLGHQKLPQGEQNPTASPEPPSSVASLVQPAADQHSNKLSVDIDDDIEDTAEEAREQVSRERERNVTNVAKPFDPNLTCPMCNKCFRIGEFKKFRHHMKSCEGTRN